MIVLHHWPTPPPPCYTCLCIELCLSCCAIYSIELSFAVDPNVPEVH